MMLVRVLEERASRFLSGSTLQAEAWALRLACHTALRVSQILFLINSKTVVKAIQGDPSDTPSEIAAIVNDIKQSISQCHPYCCITPPDQPTKLLIGSLIELSRVQACSFGKASHVLF